MIVHVYKPQSIVEYWVKDNAEVHILGRAGEHIHIDKQTVCICSHMLLAQCAIHTIKWDIKSTWIYTHTYIKLCCAQG